MVVEYVSFNRPGVTAIKMIKVPVIFKSFAGSWAFKILGTGLTEVQFLYSFDFRFPFALIGSLLKKNLQKNVRQRLRDLKANIGEQCTIRNPY